MNLSKEPKIIPGGLAVDDRYFLFPYFLISYLLKIGEL